MVEWRKEICYKIKSLLLYQSGITCVLGTPQDKIKLCDHFLASNSFVCDQSSLLFFNINTLIQALFIKVSTKRRKKDMANQLIIVTFIPSTRLCTIWVSFSLLVIIIIILLMFVKGNNGKSR